jgi:hypothetical protein
MRSKASNKPSWGLRLAAFASLAFMSPVHAFEGISPLELPCSRGEA